MLSGKTTLVIDSALFSGFCFFAMEKGIACQKIVTHKINVEFGGIRPENPLFTGEQARQQHVISVTKLWCSHSECTNPIVLHHQERGGNSPFTICIIAKKKYSSQQKSDFGVTCKDRLASPGAARRSKTRPEKLFLPRDRQETLLAQAHLCHTLVPTCISEC